MDQNQFQNFLTQVSLLTMNAQRQNRLIEEQNKLIAEQTKALLVIAEELRRKSQEPEDRSN